MSKLVSDFSSAELPSTLVAQTRDTAHEAQVAITNHSICDAAPTSQADALLTQFMTAEANGSLAQHVRDVVAKQVLGT